MLEHSVNKRYDSHIVCLDRLIPQDHLLRKIEKAVEFRKIYKMVEHLYCKDNGRPSADPVVIVKMVLIQHLYGIKSLRQTVKEMDMNIAYRWFIGYDLYTPIPHFATVSYAFATRFPSELFEEIFTWILDLAMEKGFLKPDVVFIDSTHIKANANKHKKRKILAQKTARTYDEQLRTEIEQDRIAQGKKPLKDKDDDNENDKKNSQMQEITVSLSDPDCGMFRKGEHKTEFAYSAHVACECNNFILNCEVTRGNIHDSIVFDKVYDNIVEKFPNIETITVDAGYKTPWICKKIQDDNRNISTAYKRPMTKQGFFKSYEYVYDIASNSVICPNNEILTYSTTNREGYREYKSNPKTCSACQFLAKCTSSKQQQKIVAKHIWEKHLECAEDFRHTLKGKETYRLRSQTIERVFADAKEKHGMRYTLLKGIERVTNWIKFKFAVMNLKKLAMWAY